MQKKWIVLQVSLILVASTAAGATSGVPGAVIDGLVTTSGELIESGNFSLVNTSEQRFLLKNWIYTTTIGAVWNLTVVLHGNSSSGVNFTLKSSETNPDYWEGTKEFELLPGETRFETYVSHFVADQAPEFNFQHVLVDPVKNASGTYSIEVIHRGYAANVKTGSLYVNNITAWLEQHSSTATATPGFAGMALFSSTICSLLVYRAKKKKPPFN